MEINKIVLKALIVGGVTLFFALVTGAVIWGVEYYARLEITKMRVEVLEEAVKKWKVRSKCIIGVHSKNKDEAPLGIEPRN